MKRAELAVSLLLSCIVISGPVGCSSRPKNVAPVKGKVTLAGQPLAEATLIFKPTIEGASSSRGRTNATGEYVLQYAAKVDGAVIGDHTVLITTGSGMPKAGSEKVPFKYRMTGPDQLKATVNAGQNTIDFTLEAGPVDPPQQKGKKKK